MRQGGAERDRHESLSESAGRLENSVNLNRETEKQFGSGYLEGRKTDRHTTDKKTTSVERRR